MDDDESLRQPPISVDAPSDRATPYDLLMRQSRKMGYFATRTYDVTKEFLSRDVTTLAPRSPDSILFGKKLKESASHEDDEPSPSAPKEENQKIIDALERSHEVLAAVKTVVLPMNLFPDSIIVDRTKVTIKRRAFFWTSEVITTRVDDILSVTANFGPIFGSIIISTRVMNSTDHYEIDYFFRKDAVYIKELIQGYVIAQHNKIETQHLSKEDLIKTLLDLGRDLAD